MHKTHPTKSYVMSMSPSKSDFFTHGVAVTLGRVTRYLFYELAAHNHKNADQSFSSKKCESLVWKELKTASKKHKFVQILFLVFI